MIALRQLFPDRPTRCSTWEEKQGPLLAAIEIESGILNVLLFMIVGVAGFGILAIFSMIVIEKTRDIGILKALGASQPRRDEDLPGLRPAARHAVGARLGTATRADDHPIPQRDRAVRRPESTGQEIFDRSVYYFDKIPTFVQPMSVVLINLGSVAIAVLFSVLPALRGAAAPGAGAAVRVRRV